MSKDKDPDVLYGRILYMEGKCIHVMAPYREWLQDAERAMLLHPPVVELCEYILRFPRVPVKALRKKVNQILALHDRMGK